MNDYDEYQDENPKVSHSKSKKRLNRDLKALKYTSQDLREKRLEESAELERLKAVVSNLQQEKEQIEKSFETKIDFASIEIKLDELSRERDTKIQEIDAKIETAQKKVTRYETSIEKGTNTKHIREELDETKQKTFDDFKDYMTSSAQFEALEDKLKSYSKGMNAMDPVSTDKYLILKDCVDALKEAKNFSMWEDGINDLKGALTSSKLSERRTEGMTFFDHLTERSTKNLIKDFLDYNHDKHDDLWYRSGAQSGPSKW